jgi:hypothetical protein
MKIKSIPVIELSPSPFSPIPDSPKRTVQIIKEERRRAELDTSFLATEARKEANREKGKAADEHYLSQRQNAEAAWRRLAETGEGPWDDTDYDDPTAIHDDILEKW